MRSQSSPFCVQAALAAALVCGCGGSISVDFNGGAGDSGADTTVVSGEDATAEGASPGAPDAGDLDATLQGEVGVADGADVELAAPDADATAMDVVSVQDAGAGDASDAGAEVGPEAGDGPASETSSDAAPGDATVAEASSDAPADVVTAAVCTPSAQQCLGNGVQTCNDAGQWGDAVPCVGSPCVSGVCAGSDCLPGCQGNSVESCDAGEYTPPVPCVNQACINGACFGVCAPGQVRCNGNTLEVCEAIGSWGTLMTCSDAAPLCSDGGCVAN
jgi:hypothetical protein